MPKFDFKPGDEAYIVQKEKHRVEGPYRVASIRKGGIGGPQALILEGNAGTVAHTDPDTVFHGRDAARSFALNLVEREILEVKGRLEKLEKKRSFLLMKPKYLIGESVWVYSQYANLNVEGPFVIDDVYPYASSVTYCLRIDAFPGHRDVSEEHLYATREEAKAVAVKVAAKLVADAQEALDKAKAKEKEIING